MWASGSDMHTHTLYGQIKSLCRDPSVKSFLHTSIPRLGFSSPLSVLLPLRVSILCSLVGVITRRRGTDQDVYTPGCLHARARRVRGLNTLTADETQQRGTECSLAEEKNGRKLEHTSTREAPRCTAHACCGQMMLHHKGS